LQKQDNSNQADFSAASMRIRPSARQNLILPQNGKPKTIEAV